MHTAPPSAQADAVAEGLFEAIVDQASEAIVFADTGGVIRVWNTGAQALFGFDRAEAVGNSLDLIIPERFRRGYSVVLPSKCSSLASASALVTWTVPSLCSGGP